MNALKTFKKDAHKLFSMLGLALILPMVLLSGPLAGYWISQWLIRQWHLTSTLTLLLTLGGLLLSMIQAARIIKQLYQADKKNS